MARVTSTGAKTRKSKQAVSWWRKRRWFITIGLASVLVLTLVIAGFISSQPKTTAPPEAERVLAAQSDLPFGILIPAYMPKGFDRKNVTIDIKGTISSKQPNVTLTYYWQRKNAAIHIREWVPGNPALETLNGSRPVETRWGKGYLLTYGGPEGVGSMSDIWVDLGQLRISISTGNLDVVSREDLLQMANTLGLASNLQVYNFVSEPVVIQGIEPPAPFEVAVNIDGIQELNLTITPGGYSPIRFAVKAGVPVKINFRALGEVGCGILMNFPVSPTERKAFQLDSRTDMEVIEFTPTAPGEYDFYCTHNTFRGIMTVRP